MEEDKDEDETEKGCEVESTFHWLLQLVVGDVVVVVVVVVQGSAAAQNESAIRSKRGRPPSLAAGTLASG